MNKLKFFTSCLIFLLVFSAAYAQRPGQGPMKSAEERAQALTDRMVTEIGLNDDQKAQVHAINLTSFNKRDSLRNSIRNREITREEAMAKNEAISLEQDSAIRALLNEEQLPKYEKMSEEMRKRFEGQRQGGRGRQRP